MIDAANNNFCVGPHLVDHFRNGLLGCDREHSPLGEVSLYDWSPVLQVWTQQLHYIQITHIYLIGQIKSGKTGDQQLYSVSVLVVV